jgi:hypothetical protein
MKLLREIYINNGLHYSVDIISKLLSRIHDSEETVAVNIDKIRDRP